MSAFTRRRRARAAVPADDLLTNGYLDEFLAQAEAELASDRTLVSPRSAPRSKQRAGLGQEVRDAISSGDPFSAGFNLRYLPQLSIGSGDLEGVEALLRFDAPQSGLLSPDGFLELVGDSALMEQLTLAVARTAIDETRALREAGRALAIGINVPVAVFLGQRFQDHLTTQLEHGGLAPADLTVELPVLAFTKENDDYTHGLSDLQRKGTRLLIDNYGNRPEDSEALWTRKADQIKIDRGLVRDLLGDPAIRAGLHDTIDTAHDLGIRVVAQGVETDEQLDLLQTLGVDSVQGFLFAGPLDRDNLTHWINEQLPNDTVATH